jgi:Glycosyl hydrolase family 95 catalytic domain
VRTRGKFRSSLVAAATALALTSLALVTGGSRPAAAATAVTTAWHHGSFAENPAGVVSRSDVVIKQPNFSAAQFLPLGNGSLGVAAWAANGFTAQLNRDDTFPDRKSPGQVTIPGLAAMTTATDFTGRLDLYDGVLTESGGGMTVKAWVSAGQDLLIVDVTGANPATAQTASVNLWSGRTPTAAAANGTGTLAETWADNTQTGASGQTFGSLAAITAGGRDVTASATGPEQVQVSFRPHADGSYRIAVAAPHWAGGNAAATAARLLTPAVAASETGLLNSSASWWHRYWAHAGLLEMSSADGSAQYLENIRTLYLYDEAASMRGTYAGSQAGVADMFAYDQDKQDWYPSGYWIWNLRGQVAANLSSGNSALNTPLLAMYLRDLPAIESWTKAQMGGLPGACVPETMRFNGNGYYNGGSASANASCALASSPSYNAETITSGTEVALWVWQEYADTGDLAFLKKYYPLIQQTAIFLLAYQKLGPDGYLHAVANAHETQWAVTDPTTDIAAMQALFPVTVEAARLLGTDRALSARLAAAEKEIPPYARTDQATHTQLLTPAADASGTDVIGDSYQPTAPFHNGENIGLEPVWPYNLIGDSTVVNGDNLTALADRTYDHRPNVTNPDWSFDAVDAARLDMPAQVQSDLVTLTEHYQAYISGLGNLFGSSPGDEPYIEQSSTVATALDEALATDYDGLLRIAPAWPASWNVSGTVYVAGHTKVDVQVQNGAVTTSAIIAGASRNMTVRNPWPGQQAEVVSGATGQVVVASTSAATLRFHVTAGRSYLVEQAASPTTSYPFAEVTGTPATAARHLGNQRIGLDAPVHYPSLAASYDNVAISSDSDTAPGNFDGGGASFSAQALAAAGASPGATVTSSGMSFTFPAAAAGTSDNTVADNQWIGLSGSGTTLGFLVSGSYGPVTGTGQIVYTDGSTQSYTLTAPDWFSTTPPAGGAVAVSSAYQNRQGNTTYGHTADIFSVTVPINPAKTLAAVLLPAVGSLASGTPALHVFALATS